MKKSHKVLLMVLGLIVLAVAGFKAMQPKEPEYQGRKLSEWIADLGEPSPDRSVAEAAMLQAKEVFLPFIEKHLRQMRKPQISTRLGISFLEIQRAFGVGYRQSAVVQWSGSFKALKLFGNDALPTLERLLREEDTAESAAYVLRGLNAVEALAKGTEPGRSQTVRITCIQALSAVIHGGGKAVRVLLPLTHDSDETVVWSAVGSLGELKTEPEIVVPRFCELIESKTNDLSMQAHVMISLRGYGTNAAVAIPLLLKLSAATNSAISIIAKQTLDEVVPQQNP